MKVSVLAGLTKHELYLGDSLKIIREIRSQSIDVVITSPIYNIGKKYNTDEDDMPRSVYLDWCSKWLTELKRVLADTGHFFLNIGSKPSSPLGPFEVFGRTQQAGWVLQNFLAWVKSISIDTPEGITSTGQFKPLNSDRFVNDLWEPIFWLSKQGSLEQDAEWSPVFHLTKDGKTPINRYHPDVGVPHQDQTNVTRWASGKKVRCRGNTLFAPYDTIQSRDERPHPASYPVRLVTMLLGLADAQPGATVLDPFLGSGSTSIGCLRKGLNSIGIEKDPTYFEGAVERLVNEAKQMQLPVEVSFTG